MRFSVWNNTIESSTMKTIYEDEAQSPSTDQYDTDFGLPPRSKTHHKKRKRRRRQKKKEKLPLLFVKILFFTFLSVVVSVLLMLLWQETLLY